MGNITIDGISYETDDLSDNAKAQVASLQFNEAHMNSLRNQLAIADTARMAYTNALKKELEAKELEKKEGKKKSDKI